MNTLKPLTISVFASMQISERRLNILKAYYLLIEHLMNKMVIENNRNQAKVRIHEAIKKYSGVQSFRILDDKRLYKIVQQTRMTFARDFGILLKEPGEPDNIDELEMKEFINLIYK